MQGRKRVIVPVVEGYGCENGGQEMVGRAGRDGGGVVPASLEL